MRKSKQQAVEQVSDGGNSPNPTEQKPKSRSVIGRLFGGSKAKDAANDQLQASDGPGTSESGFDNPAFGTTAPPTPEAEPELEFNLTPGYDAYLREKAAEEAAALAQAATAPAPPPAPPVTADLAPLGEIAPAPAMPAMPDLAPLGETAPQPAPLQSVAPLTQVASVDPAPEQAVAPSPIADPNAPIEWPNAA